MRENVVGVGKHNPVDGGVFGIECLIAAFNFEKVKKKGKKVDNKSRTLLKHNWARCRVKKNRRG